MSGQPATPWRPTWEQRRDELQALRDQFAAMPPGTTVHQQYGTSIVPTSAGQLVEDLDDAIALGPLLYEALHETLADIDRQESSPT